ncbi:MAG: hypothetical protein J0I10_05830 [Verrucomicrobia bacterium]|nr:hypothetical protein [Verrucomicrobiota bacterium]
MKIRRFSAIALLSLTPLGQTYAGWHIINFDAESGDRQAEFGSGNSIEGGMIKPKYDNTHERLFFIVQGGALKCKVHTEEGRNLAWIVYDDTEPETLNTTRPPGWEQFEYSAPLVIRARLTNLTSGSNGTPARGGILVGLSDSGPDASGLLFAIENSPSGSAEDDYLRLYSFKDGDLGSELDSSIPFSFGSSTSPYFLQLTLSSSGSAIAYKLELFSDASIPGSGSDQNRLLSSSFQTATPVASIGGNLNDLYSKGFVGLLFESEPGSLTSGEIDIDSFFISADPMTQ